MTLKALIAVATVGAVFSILLANNGIVETKKIIFAIIEISLPWAVLYILSLLLAVIILMIGCFKLIATLYAKVSTNHKKDFGICKDSKIFFDKIAENENFDSYKRKVNNMSVEDLRNDVLSQIYICSIRCKEKFQSYKTGLLFSTIGSALFFILFVIGTMIIS